MVARVRALSYGRRAAIGPLAAVVVAAQGLPGTVVPVPTSTSLALAGVAPNISLSGQKRARIRTLSFAPTSIGSARAASRIYPAFGITSYNTPAGNLSLTGFAPTVQTANVTIAPPPGQLSLTGITELAGLNIAGTVVVHLPPEGRYRPPPKVTVIAIRRALNVEVPIPTSGLALTTAPPLIDTTGNVVLNILPGQLALSPFAPTPTSVITVTVPTASLGLTGLFALPALTANVLIVPGVSSFGDVTIENLTTLRLLGFAPVLPAGGVGVGVPFAQLVLSPFAPNVVSHLLRYRTPLSVSVAPHQTLVVVAPHQTTVNIA